MTSTQHDTLKQQDDVENRGESLRKLLNNPKKAKAIQGKFNSSEKNRKEFFSAMEYFPSRTMIQPGINDGIT